MGKYVGCYCGISGQTHLFFVCMRTLSPELLLSTQSRNIDKGSTSARVTFCICDKY